MAATSNLLNTHVSGMLKDFTKQASIWTVNLLAANIDTTATTTIDNIAKLAQTASYLAATALSVVLLIKNKQGHKELLKFLMDLVKRK